MNSEDKITDKIRNKDITSREFFYRLFFTRDDSLDVLQLLFLILVVYFMLVFLLAGIGTMKISTAAWTVFSSIFFILAIAGTPTWIATLIAKNAKPDVSIKVRSDDDLTPEERTLRRETLYEEFSSRDDN